VNNEIIAKKVEATPIVVKMVGFWFR